jgi:hypothetical protein
MPRPCGHNPPADPRECRVCFWCADASPAGRAYRELWGEPEPGAAPGPARTSACVHRGAQAREQACPSCRGHVRLKVFACAVHGECTVGKALAGLACCATCPDFAAGSPRQEPPGAAH